MSLTPNLLESSLFDFDVYHLAAPYEELPASAERAAYVVAKVPAEDLDAIHQLEDNGFRFLECQIQATGRLRRAYDVAAFPYDLEHIKTPEQLAEVDALLGDMFVHDRFTTDPWLRARGGGALSTKRYGAYLSKSFEQDDEEITALRSRETRELVAFATHKFLSDQDVLLLIGGVRRDLQNTGLGAMNDQIGLNDLKSRGYKKLITHFSAINYPILNLEIRGLGFRIHAAQLVFRKVVAAV